MRKSIILAALAASIAAPAAAVTLKAGSPVCLTEDLYSQMTTAAFRHDANALVWLAANGCRVSETPLKATVLDLSAWGGLAHVRVYRGSHAAEVWTARQSLDGYDPLKP
jgi:hypothetical protein